MEDEVDNQNISPDKGNILPEDLESFLTNLPNQSSDEEQKDLWSKLSEYTKSMYLKLIDAAYTSKKGDSKINSLISGLTKGDPKAIAELFDLRYVAEMSKNKQTNPQTKKPAPSEEAVKLLNARAAFATIAAKSKSPLAAYNKAFENAPKNALKPQLN